MNEKINKKVIKGSLILVFAFGIFNFFHFLFQFFMARMLTLEDYGILATLFSIVYISSVITESIQTILAKYSVGQEIGKIKNLLRKSFKKFSKLAIWMFFAYLVLAIPLSYLLKIDFLLLVTAGPILFTAFFTPVVRGVMQGKRRFFTLSLNLVCEALVKLVVGVGFVYFGWRVYGAMVAVTIGAVISLLFSFIQLREIIKSKEEPYPLPGIREYAKPTLFLTFIVVLFYSLDVVIAKIIFSPQQAGLYAITSVLGKILFWGTLPVSKAMFPVSAQENDGNNPRNSAFMSAFAIVLIGLVLVLSLFYIFPGEILSLFSDKSAEEISNAVPILFFTGLAFSIISIANLILLYNLSIGKIKGHQRLFWFVIIEVILLFSFSSNLVQFSIGFVVASVIFLLGVIFLMRK